MIKRLLSVLFTAWGFLWFLVPFLILFPAIFVCIQRKNWHRFGHRIIRLWSYIFFYITGMPVQKTYHFKPDKNKPYVFVANHFSFLDVAIGMNIVDNYFAYVGKSDVKNIPLFGYMFAKLHIQVDRSDKNSRTKSLLRGIKAIQNGRSVFIMPEGGILSTNIPQMLQPFKDGAFVMAVENQVPIVPITYLNNYQIQPAIILRWAIPKVIFNRPIETAGMALDDIPKLKKMVYDTIQPQLDEWYGKSN